MLRDNDWPTSLGSAKAFDTSLVIAWEESILSSMDAWLGLTIFTPDLS